MTEVAPFAWLAPVVFGAAALVFLLRIARHVRVAVPARAGERSGRPGTGVADLVRHGLLQPRMARDPVAAAIHAAVMWGFVILSIGTLDRVGLGAPGRLLALPMDGGLWHAILALQSLMAILVLGAIAGAVARRLVTRPARLTLSRDGVVILALIATIVVTETLAEADRKSTRLNSSH